MSARPGRAVERSRFLGFLVAGPTLTGAALILDGLSSRYATADGP